MCQTRASPLVGIFSLSILYQQANARDAAGKEAEVAGVFVVPAEVEAEEWHAEDFNFA